MKKLLLIFLAALSLNVNAVMYMNSIPDTKNLNPNDPFFWQHGVIITKPTVEHKKNLLRPNLKVDDLAVFKECVSNCVDIKDYWINYVDNLRQSPLLIYSNLEDMSLDFEYKGIPFVDKKDVIVNIGNSTATEVNGKMQFGGVIQLVVLKDNHTMCSFAITNLIHGLHILTEDMVTTLVNGKVTEKIWVYGKDKLGFLYNVSWYDDKFSYSLTCGYYEHDAFTRQKVLQLARLIDYRINK